MNDWDRLETAEKIIFSILLVVTAIAVPAGMIALAVWWIVTVLRWLGVAI